MNEGYIYHSAAPFINSDNSSRCVRTFARINTQRQNESADSRVERADGALIICGNKQHA